MWESSPFHAKKHTHTKFRDVPLRYVMTQWKIVKNCLVPRQLSNSLVICKWLKSYCGSFIFHHSISDCRYLLCCTCVIAGVLDYWSAQAGTWNTGTWLSLKRYRCLSLGTFTLAVFESCWLVQITFWKKEKKSTTYQ